jgi:cytochrome c-type biogenesis protein CcmH
MFWAIMIAMLLVAIGIIVFPLLKTRDGAALAYKESNLKINDEKISELDLDLSEGRIDQAFYKSAREELDRELLIDIPEESRETAAEHYTSAAKRHPAWALIISVFVPMLVFLLYLELGMHAASDESFVAEQTSTPASAPALQQSSVEEMARKLEKHIKKNGGTVEEWIMLARSHKYLGEHALAAKAFGVALEKDKNNAQLMLESAEMMALDNNRVFNTEARNLVLAAYKLEPDNANVLWFIGVAEFQEGNNQQAIDHLTKLLPLARGDKDVAKSVIGIVAKAREKLIAEGKEMPELVDLLGVEALAPEKSAVTTKSSEITDAVAKGSSSADSSQVQATRLQVTVDIEKNIKQKFNADDVVFIYAKAKQGPRMPLAAQRLTLSALPITVILDDSMAMVDGMNISAFDQLVVSARVTKSGSAIAKSGDYIGQTELEVKNKGTVTKLNLVIDTMVP